jgi:hypothetical protein
MAEYSGLRIGRLNVYAGMVARGNNGVNPPWLGFCYGYWLPRLAKASYLGCVYVDFAWLCFHASIYMDTDR